MVKMFCCISCFLLASLFVLLCQGLEKTADVSNLDELEKQLRENALRSLQEAKLASQKDKWSQILTMCRVCVRRDCVFIFEIVEQLFADIYKTVVLIAPWVKQMFSYCILLWLWSMFDGWITVRCFDAASACWWMLIFKRCLDWDDNFVVGLCVSWCFSGVYLDRVIRRFWE